MKGIRILMGRQLLQPGAESSCQFRSFDHSRQAKIITLPHRQGRTSACLSAGSDLAQGING